MLDLAHASAKSFWQAAALLRQPIFVSHACCAVLCPHRRNLTDEQLRALGQSGGWLGVTLAPAFLRASTAENAADLDDVVRHIQHAVNVAGAIAPGGFPPSPSYTAQTLEMPSASLPANKWKLCSQRLSPRS